MFNDKIVALLAEADNNVLREFFNCEIDDKEYDWEDTEVKSFRKLLKDEKITFKEVDRYGGEDQGSDYWSVYSFNDGMQVVFIQFQGWYASYSGSEFTEWFFVEPKKVEVVEYVAIKN